MLAQTNFTTRRTREARGKRRDITYLFRGSDLSGHWNNYVRNVISQEQLLRTKAAGKNETEALIVGLELWSWTREEKLD